MKLIYTLILVCIPAGWAWSQASNAGQKNHYREAVNMYRQDAYLYTGTVYGIFQVPVGAYRAQVQGSRGWGLGIENRVSFIKWDSDFKPVYALSTTVNRWSRNGIPATDWVLSGQAGLNYIFPMQHELLKTYVQGLLGVAFAGSYLTQPSNAADINHQGFGPTGLLGAGVYMKRFNLGLAYNFLNSTLKNETQVTKNLNALQLRLGARL